MANSKFILELISTGKGIVLDLGGGRGLLRDSLRKLGYHYISVNI